MPNQALIGTATAARDLGVHRSTLTRMVKAGALTPVIRGEGIRGEMYFDADDIARIKSEAVNRRRGEGQP